MMSLSSSSSVHPVRRLSYYTPLNDVVKNTRVLVRCESKEEQQNGEAKLRIGSPIIVTEAPKMIKTAASVPCLRVNAGLIKPGDVGRIVSRKPMDVWAVRLSIGTYLIDAKYFKAFGD